MKTFDLYWSPEGRKIATVDARDARAATRKAPMPYRKFLGEIYATEKAPMRCDSCEMVSINGVACHEPGCPNDGARWDGETWVKQRTCRECGQTVDVDDPCCSAEQE